jgi:hypothetical protein
MGNPRARDVRQSTTYRELSTYVIEQPIVVPTASIERIESGADASRSAIVSDERWAIMRSNGTQGVTYVPGLICGSSTSPMFPAER